jgi:hypothetical protein
VRSWCPALGRMEPGRSCPVRLDEPERVKIFVTVPALRGSIEVLVNGQSLALFECTAVLDRPDISGTVALGAGSHTIRVEFTEATGMASVQINSLGYYPIESPPSQGR